MHRIIIAGSRTFTNKQFGFAKLDQILGHLGRNEAEIVSGRCPRGADQIGVEWAQKQRLRLKSFPADWDKHGNRAGPIRNGQMAEYATHLIAFWDGTSRGTADMINKAKAAGLKVKVIEVS